MKFIKSAFNEDDYLIDKNEICLIGRSNVGKSSIINALANEKIANVSATPGRTQLVNYFDCINYYLVDLPGYGYAKLSKQQQQELVYVVENYLFKSKKLKAIFQVVDANVITKLDIEMSIYFNKLNLFHYVIINKIDKQSNKDSSWVNKIASQLKVSSNNIIVISALKKINITKLKGLLDKIGRN